MPKTPRLTPLSFSSKDRKDAAPEPDLRDGPAAGHAKEVASDFASQRKLIRPVLPENAPGLRDPQRRGFRAILTRREMTPAAYDVSSAEGFYFQKQMQAQTQMVFVLEDGEHVEGYIEWYDRNCIKVRNSGRVLIYKSAIKYLFKASERQGDWSTMA
jgi:sRNA-binding regulator protein Hfq